MKPLKRFVSLDKKQHDRKSFDCGNDQLNLFLREKAAKHAKVGTSKTMVLPAARRITPKAICAFYTLSHSTIERDSLPRNIAKTLPFYPIPVLLLAQLAVHKEMQGKGLGKISLVVALRHCVKINDSLASIAVVVDAIDDNARLFYERYGFETLVSNRLFLPIHKVEKI